MNKVFLNLAVGAGQHHHSELSGDIYNDPKTHIYVDSNASARTELATLDASIVGEVGDIINGHSSPPSTGITIFHSMGKIFIFHKLMKIFKMEFIILFKGMAVEDVAVGQAILESFKNKPK